MSSAFLNQLSHLARILELDFKDIELLPIAFTHKTYDKIHNYQRLEFLGDSILTFIISKNLFIKYPLLSESQLSKLRMQVICGSNLADIATRLNLVDYVRYKGTGLVNDKLKEDLVESLLGAIFLDSGIEEVENFIKKHFSLPEFNNMAHYYKENINYKGSLQEIMQINGYSLPIYSGSNFNEIYEVKCKLAELDLTETASSSSQKVATQLVAKKMLEILLKEHKLTLPKSIKKLEF